MTTVTCDYCHKTIQVKLDFSVGSTLSGHLRRCKVFKQHEIKILKSVTKEYLIEEYLVKQRSIHEIRQELGLRKQTKLVALFSEFSIPLRTKEERYNTKRRREKTEATCLEKYGSKQVLQKGSVVRKKLVDNLIKNHNVVNVFQREDVKNTSKQTCFEHFGSEYFFSSEIGRQRIANTNLKKYGVDNPWKSQEIIQRLKEIRFQNPKLSYSNQSKDFFYAIYENIKFLDLNVYFLPLNKEFGKRTEKQYYYYDFVIPELKFCLEYNGNYHHANPRMYAPDFVVYGKKASEIQINDKKKLETILKFDFEVWVVWELDYVGNEIFFIRLISQYIIFLKTFKAKNRLLISDKECFRNKTKCFSELEDFIYEEK